MRPTRIWLIGAFLLLLATAAPVQAASTYTVNPALPDNTQCATLRLCRTIQAAIDAASSGDTIVARPGTFIENLTITKPLTINGAGQGVSIIKPALSAANPCAGSSLCGGAASNIILVQADNVTINGFTLDGDNPALASGIMAGGADLDARNGIITNHALGVYTNLVVSNVTVKNIYLRGMYASSGGTFNFRDNIVQNVQADPASIGMFNFGGAGIYERNIVVDANDAIAANHSKGTQFLGNVVVNSASGVHSDNAGDGGGTADRISGNTVSNCMANGYGIWDFVAYIAPVIESNKIVNCAVGLASFGNSSSFTAGPAVPTTFTNNTVDGQGLAGSVGVFITTDQVGYGDGTNSAFLYNNAIVNNAVGVQTEQKNGKTVSLSLRYNNISGNTTTGIDNAAGATVDAARNWWGSAAGPGGGNNGISGVVTTAPYALALASSATASTHEIGEVATLDTQVTAAGLYGAQLVVNHASSLMTFTPAGSSYNSTGGWFWDFRAASFSHPTPNQTMLAGTMLAGAPYNHPTAATLTGQSIATWKYTCVAAGTGGLGYDYTAGTGAKLSDVNGFEIVAGLTGDLVTCTAATSAVDGYLKLQGRVQGATAPAGWNDATVVLTCTGGACMAYGPIGLATDVNGHYVRLKTTPGSGIPNGTYSATAYRRAYLPATKAGAVVVAGTLTINALGTAPTLAGGDVNGDDKIDIADLAAIGGAFGTSITPDTGADVNGDGFVNVFDLVLAGGNYGLTASTWTP
ncbi:MAG: hypothetical protein HZB53_15280 [Chloroflexi bacterium]|nr:hypothetical protein [Chloroflexota bacterium]